MLLCEAAISISSVRGMLADRRGPSLLRPHLTVAPPRCPPGRSYLYDAAGSELYERITELEEYYPFRTEQALLRQHVHDICSYILPGAPPPLL